MELGKAKTYHGYDLGHPPGHKFQTSVLARQVFGVYSDTLDNVRVQNDLAPHFAKKQRDK